MSPADFRAFPAVQPARLLFAALITETVLLSKFAT